MKIIVHFNEEGQSVQSVIEELIINHCHDSQNI